MSSCSPRALSIKRLDRLGSVIALTLILAPGLLPFALLRPNRIAAPQGVPLWQALPQPAAGLALLALVVLAGLFLWRGAPRLRLLAAALGLVGQGVAIGLAARHLLPPGNGYARVSPGAGFWLLLAALGLALADALARERLRPGGRVLALALALAALALMIGSGLWRDLSVLREAASREAAFVQALQVHAALALSSVAMALMVGLPLGIWAQRRPRLREGLLAGLNMVQTVPSMALFGLMIAPLAWLAASWPGLAALGVAGIGPAPAFLALWIYALLPVVASVLAGLEAVPGAVRAAADGMGMSARQRLWQVELPLALPAILTGLRLVLVQNIGLAVIAGLVGGGGLGVFVFQGLSQTAPDLVMLGALPTVVMALAAAVLLDAGTEWARRGRSAPGEGTGG